MTSQINQKSSGPFEADNADAAFVKTLREIETTGEVCVAGTSNSVGSNRETKELLNFQFTISHPRQRLIHQERRAIRLPWAIARFVWMMAANNRLADIAYYVGHKAVGSFSDDGVLVPGSSYGARMLQPRPGLDQITAVVDRLRKDPTSRRAAVAIYQAEDAVRESRDIPCAFGLFYHIRDSQLHATQLMRSNNAMKLLPFNLFEFSLLAELVQAELSLADGLNDLALGRFTYFAGSMHNYQEDRDKIHAVLATEPRTALPIIPPIPVDGGTRTPVQQVKALVQLESRVKFEIAGFTPDSFDAWIQESQEKLLPYWQQFFYLLLLVGAQTRKQSFALERLEKLIESPWREYLTDSDFLSTVPYVAPIQDLFGGSVQVAPAEESLRTERHRSIEALALKKSDALIRNNEPPLSIQEFLEIRQLLDAQKPIAGIAARNNVDDVKFEDIEAMVELLRPRDGEQAQTDGNKQASLFE